MDDTGRDFFLAAIRAAPDDLLPRLVYADWLDERGEPEGELVRLLCEVQSAGYTDGPAWERLASLTGDLNAELGRLGGGELRMFACDCVERRLPPLDDGPAGDDRPWRLLSAARRYALGLATQEELAAAAESASKAAPASRRSWGYPERVLHEARLAAWCTPGMSRPVGKVIAGTVAAAGQELAADPAEARWQLARALEYRLGFVPPLFDESEAP